MDTLFANVTALFSVSDITALISVILIDLALAGDNAVAVGVAAATLPRQQRRRAIVIGVTLALVLRVAFALGTIALLQIKGILFVGGLLLVWVAWRMWRDLDHQRQHAQAQNPQNVSADGAVAAAAKAAKPASFGRALLTIVIADVSMSLDNVLAVAGVSRHTPWIMVFGLGLSVLLMGVAASFIARVIEKYRWIAILGIAIILVAAARMMWEDLAVWFPEYIPSIPGWLGGRPVSH